MIPISIKKSNLDTINFIEANISNFRGKKIFLSSSLFDNLWEKCYNENGEVATLNLNHIGGILKYTFVFPALENEKINGKMAVKILDCGYNERMKRFKVLEIKSKYFHYESPKFSLNVYLNDSEITETKSQDRIL